jgi:uncharacterized protein YbbC (DUF1343 family)
MAVRTGLDRLLAGEVKGVIGAKAGLIANPTSLDRQLRHAADLLVATKVVELRALFGPEHGLRGDAQDMIGVAAERDARTGLPVYSLYGRDELSLSPTPESLRGLDTLLFDIQDIGSRYYTYVWTLVLAMRVCARAGVRVVVLDRPNPIGGECIEGGTVEAGYRSFVGLCSLPVRHGLTAGEVARFALETENLDLDLEVVTMEGWKRSDWYDATALPWVLPSPNMPTLDTALVYPGMCLIEATELSEGRGTTRPFEIAGAPFVDGFALACCLDQERLPGVLFRPLIFTPTFQKWAAARCGGVQIHVTDRRAFRSYLTGVAFVRAVHQLWPEEFAWRRQPYEFRGDLPAIDLLTGSKAVREGIEQGATLDELAATWEAEQAEFAAVRARWLLY